MGAKNTDALDSEADLMNVDATESATNQEGIVLPWFAGEGKFALKWLSPPYNQFTRLVPQERPGKKG
jgi:hypothetical protein